MDASHELFSALQGGGGNYGVVTAFVFAVAPVTDALVGQYRFPLARGPEVLQMHQRLCAQASETTTIYCLLTQSPPALVLVAVSLLGTPPEGDEPEWVAALEGVGPEWSAVGRQRIPRLNQLFDEGNRHGKCYRWSRSTYLNASSLAEGGRLCAQLLELLADPRHAAAVDDDAGLTIQLTHMGGAVRRGPPGGGPTAFVHRGFDFEAHAIVKWDQLSTAPAAKEAKERAVRAFSALLAEHGDCGYVNIESSKDAGFVERAYGQQGPRLREMKGKYDPRNFFHNNHNICPNGDSAPTVWRLLVQAKPPPPPPPAAAVGGLRPPLPPPPRAQHAAPVGGSTSARAIEAARARLSAAPPPTAPRNPESSQSFWCDGCMEPIEPAAVRYHGAETGDYDLCETCHSAAQAAGKLDEHLWVERPLSERKLATDGRSVAQILFDAMHNYRDRWCLGTRHGDEYCWITFGDLLRRVRACSLGLQHGLNVRERSFVGLAAARNSPEFIVADISCSACNFVSVPIHLPSDLSTIAAIIDECHFEVVICTAPGAEQLVSAIRSGHCRSIKVLVCMDPVPDDVKASAAVGQLPKVLCLSDVEAMGAAHSEVFTPESVPPDELVTIMYTSGSTGRPKGAMLSSAVMARRVGPDGLFPDPLISISYMPPAHSFDRVASLQMIAAGGRLAFHCLAPSELLETFQLVRPTVFSSTPRLWNSLHAQYCDNLAVACAGVTDKRQLEEIEASELEIFRAKLGGRLSTIGTGGAKTSATVLRWMNACFWNATVSDGYGTTEAGGISHDGIQMSRTAVKLIDRPDMGYTTLDKPFSRGEICVSNDEMILGYFKKPAVTDAAFFFADGKRWYKTGDIGEQRAVPGGGTSGLVVIDRCQNLFKTAQGEFIAPERLEQIFVASEFVDSIWIFGEPTAEYLLAVVVPRGGNTLVKAVSAVTDDPDVFLMSVAAICSDPSLSACASKVILASLKKVAELSTLASYEIPRVLLLDPEPWTSESGCRTSTMKLCRPALKQRYKTRLQELQDRLEAVDLATVPRGQCRGGNADDTFAAARYIRADLWRGGQRLLCTRWTDLGLAHRQPRGA